MEKNLTTGSVFKAILTFALPYLLSYFLQTLYGMADLYITGRFCGVDSITAVANGSQVMHMLTVIIVGLAMGSTVIIGHAVGRAICAMPKPPSATPSPCSWRSPSVLPPCWWPQCARWSA